MTIYSLGYEKRNIQEYIQILNDAKVHKLIDVRETAWSYKRDFCKSRLTSALAEVNIEYVHIKELGNPKKIRKSEVPHNEILKLYKSYLRETESGINYLKDIIQTAIKKKQNICLTCFEREHLDCHRSIIIRLIKSKIPAVNVIHL